MKVSCTTEYDGVKISVALEILPPTLQLFPEFQSISDGDATGECAVSRPDAERILAVLQQSLPQVRKAVVENLLVQACEILDRRVVIVSKEKNHES